MIKITNREFSISSAINSIKLRDSVGAVVSFLGIVRGKTGGQKVKKLEYEAYKEMAEQKMRKLEKEALKKFDIIDLVIIHRVGTLKVSENVVLIAVSAPHRKEAFTTCEWLIERLKKNVPIFKKEYLEKERNGRWVNLKK
jgi:molybdopterin synthase catalytic subunit